VPSDGGGDGAPGNLESWKTGVLDGRGRQVSRFPDPQLAATDDAVTQNPVDEIHLKLSRSRVALES